MQFFTRIFVAGLFLSLISLLIVDCKITCYDCHSSINFCAEKRPTSKCSDDKPYCMFSWNRRTGMTAQGCADLNLCGNPRSKRGLYYSVPGEEYETVPNTDEIINCCNYDYCNCVGNQCKPILAQAPLLTNSWPMLAVSISLPFLVL